MFSVTEFFEVGLIKNGIQIVKINFPKLEEFRKINPLLMSGFIQVLNDFIDIEFKDVPEQLQMEKFCAYFYPIMDPNDENNNLIFYTFCQKNIKYFEIRLIFDKLIKLLENEIILLFLKSPNKSVVSTTRNLMKEKFTKFLSTTSYDKKLSKF